MEGRTNRIQDLIRDRQTALKSQKELLDKYLQQNNAVRGMDDDIDNIISNMLKECGLSETTLTSDDEQTNGINFNVVGNLGSETSDLSLGVLESNIAKSIGTVDINIVETSKDTFEKGIQADISASNQKYFSENIGVNYNLDSTAGQSISLSLSIPTKNGNGASKEENEAETNQNQKLENNEESSSKSIDNDYENTDVLKSSEFMDFFKRTSRLIERALGEGAVFDPFFNIGSEISTRVLQTEQNTITNPGNISVSTSNGLLKNSIVFQHSSIFNRPVTCIRSHPNFPEYFIASYGNKFLQNTTFDGINHTSSVVSSLEYGGCALIWSISTPNNPENTFISPCSVLTVAFDPFCQFRYVGTTYNGEILVWDSRNGKIPFQKSNSIGISDTEGSVTSSHSFPIYCMELLGNKGSQNIITIDIDGKLCNWNLTNLSEPVESFQLRKANSKDISVQCMTLSRLINPNTIICGSEDGSIYQTIIKTNKPGTITSTFQNAHSGFITCLDYHPINDCFLSSSADWTIKLWVPNPISNSFTLLHTFEASENYVIGVSWHPIHPGVFAAIDADSTLIIYNLTSTDGQTPLCKINTSSSQPNTNTSDIPTCISWSNDGTRLFIGYLCGNIIMCNVDSKLYKPSGNVWDLFNQEIEKLKNSNSSDPYPNFDQNENTNEENE